METEQSSDRKPPVDPEVLRLEALVDELLVKKANVESQMKTAGRESPEFEALVSQRVELISQYVEADAELTELREPFEDPESADVVSLIDKPASENELPDIYIRGQFREVVDLAAEALVHTNEPAKVFRRGGRLCHFKVADERTGEEVLADFDPAGFMLELSRRANWFTLRAPARRGDKPHAVDADPPEKVVKTLLASPPEGIPAIRRVARCAYMRADGTLVTGKGFKPEDGVYLAEDHSLMEAPPAKPTAEDVKRARGLLEGELLVDFPFATTSDKAHALAMFLEPLVTEIVGESPYPLHIIEASTVGSGKTLLMDVFGIIVLGHKPAYLNLPREAAEQEKTILAAFMRQETVFAVDNLKMKLDVPILEIALTGRVKGRILGKSEMTATLSTIGVTSGVTMNGGECSDDILRRSVFSRLDPHTEQGAKRTFKRRNLSAWVQENRLALITALLTLVRHWLAQGARPFTTRTLPSYERWGEVIGGILESAGVDGFLQDEDARLEMRGEETGEWHELSRAWRGCFGDRWVSAREVLDELVAPVRRVEVKDDRGNPVRVDAIPPTTVAYLPDALGEAKVGARAKRLGHLLRKRWRQVFGGLELQRRQDSHTKVWEYRFAEVNPTTPAAPSTTSEGGNFSV